VLDAALGGDVCAGQDVPRRVRLMIGSALRWIDTADLSPPRKAALLRSRARRTFTSAARAAAAALRRRPKLSPDCAATIVSAVGQVNTFLTP